MQELYSDPQLDAEMAHEISQRMLRIRQMVLGAVISGDTNRLIIAAEMLREIEDELI